MDPERPHRSPAVQRVRVRRKNQLTLPTRVAAALRVGEGDEVEFDIGDHGEVILRGLAVVPADQRWFWTEEWQQGEREASEQIAADDVTTYDSAEDMFDALER
jgi:antitoxin PrlF